MWWHHEQALASLLGFALVISPVNGAAHRARRKPPSPPEQRAYDTNVRAFSPDGSIYQIEYASQAVEKGSLAIGVQVEQGVILAALGRKQSPLLKRSSVHKVNMIDRHVSCAVSGLLPDGGLMVNHARNWAEEHRFEFDEPGSVQALAAQLSRLALKFNGYDSGGNGAGGGGSDESEKELAMARPMGVAMLLGGQDHHGPVLYHLDPSGSYFRWRAKAIGGRSEAADAKLEQANYQEMTLRAAVALVLRVFKAVLQDDFATERLEMACLEYDDGPSVAGSRAGDADVVAAGSGGGAPETLFRGIGQAEMEDIMREHECDSEGGDGSPGAGSEPGAGLIG